jgi:hypothetical protein
MMIKTKRTVTLFLTVLALAIPARHTAAQTTTATTGNLTSGAFDTTGFPQWAKDLRRGEIVAFGSFPFTMFFTTFFMDTRRWIDQNGMDMSEEGRRYAPWPLKTAGAVLMTDKEYETTFIMAASLSAAIAIADFVIVQIKRGKARQRAESLPAGSIIINRKPWPPSPDSGTEPGPEGGETAPEAPAAP